MSDDVNERMVGWNERMQGIPSSVKYRTVRRIAAIIRGKEERRPFSKVTREVVVVLIEADLQHNFGASLESRGQHGKSRYCNFPAGQ